MTIITKALSGEKKGDILEVPLVINEPSAPQLNDVERQKVVILRARVRRVSTSTTLCLLLTSLVVVSIGIIGGKYLYDQYIAAQMHRFKGYATIPMDYQLQKDQEADSTLMEALTGQGYFDRDRPGPSDAEFNRLMTDRFFREGFEIDLDREQYEKIDVPDFKYGRSGRFIHDFNANLTGIIDVTGNRCFVMPLNRATVLPPRSLFDLIHKTWAGYYKVDTEIVRETMRVVTPPLDDLKEVGTYIATECKGRPVYKLEKYVEGVVKRSADLHVEAKFAQFSGNKITEFDIVNIEDVEKFEETQKLQ